MCASVEPKWNRQLFRSVRLLRLPGPKKAMAHIAPVLCAVAQLGIIILHFFWEETLVSWPIQPQFQSVSELCFNVPNQSKSQCIPFFVVEKPVVLCLDSLCCSLHKSSHHSQGLAVHFGHESWNMAPWGDDFMMMHDIMMVL